MEKIVRRIIYVLSNFHHICKGYFIRWFIWLYKKIINEEDVMNKVAFKSATCPECVFNGECIECGCPTMELFCSDKPCPRDKF